MAKYYNSFEFIGEISLPKDKEKQLVVTKFESGWEKHKLALSIRESRANSAFLELSALYNPSETNKVFSISKEGGKLEFPFKDRFTAIPMVADFKKLVFNAETNKETKTEANKLAYQIRQMERKGLLPAGEKEKLAGYKALYAEKTTKRREFVTEYDLINFIYENFEAISKHKIKVRGNVEMSEYKGKYYTNYIPTYFELVEQEETNKLSLKVDVFFNKDAVDEKDFRETKKVFVEGYLMNNDRVAKADRFYPRMFVLNGTNVDFENTQEAVKFDFKKNLFKVKGKEYYHMIWDVSLYRGAEVKEFSKDDLTEQQQIMVSLGLATLESFRPAGGVFGESIDELRLELPIMKDDFASGAVESDYNVNDFEEMIATSTAEISYNNAKNKETPASTQAIEGLFN